MKTKLFILTALLMAASFGLFGQVTLLTESFETDGNGTRYTSNQAGACSDFFDRVNATPSCFGQSISNADGNWYMASEDVVDRPGGGEGIITFNNINTSGYTNLTVSIKAATSDGLPASWEVDDHVFIEYAFDGNIGSNYAVAGLFQGNPPSGNNSGFLTVDSDNNPNTAGPYGTQLSSTGVLNNFTFSIPATGNSLSIRVRIAQDGGTEEFAYDLVEVKGTLPPNNAPVLDNIEGTAINYTEGDPATQVTNTISVADSENDPITSATVEISSGFASGEDVLTFTAASGISGSQTGATLTLTGSATAAQYQSVLRSVKYRNTNTSNPSIATRTISFQASDGGASNIGTRNINFAQTLNSPIALPACESFETDGHGTRYYAYEYNSGNNDFWERHNTAGGTAHPSHGAAISGADGTWIWAGEDVSANNPNPSNLGEMLLQPFQAGGATNFQVEIDLATARPNDDRWETNDYVRIQYSMDGGSWITVGAFYGTGSPSGNLVEDADLNGTADPAGTILSTALQRFTYNFAASGTTLEVRVLNKSNGSEELAFDRVCVSANVITNAAPVLANIEVPDITYLEGSGAQQVSSTITVSDPEADPITGASISVFQGFDAIEDVLTFSPQFGVTGNFVGNTLTLTGSATAAQYQTLLRSVTYNNTDGTDPSLQNRTIQFLVSDGNVSNAQTRDIVVDASLSMISLPACESFETDGQGTRYLAYAHRNGNDFWERHLNSSKPTGHQNAITGADGSYIWVGEDVVNTTNPNPLNLGEMLLQPYDITGAATFTLDVDLAVSNLSNWETTDYLFVQYRVDGGAWQPLGAFYGNGTTKSFQEDTDLNGVSDGSSLTNALTTFSYNASVSGSALEIRLLHDSDGNEEIGFDKICVDKLLPPPPSCTISSITVGTQTPCVNNQYSQEVTVTYSNAPATGLLDVNGHTFAITGSPQTETLTGLPTTGSPVNLIASFTADPQCSFTSNSAFLAPGPCVPATGLDFDGTDDRVQLGPLSVVGSISIEAWVKPSSKNNFLTILSTKSAGLFQAGFLFAINEFNSSNGKLVFETNNAAVFSNASVAWDVWQHVAFTYDGTTAKMYINGVDVGVTFYNTGVDLQASTVPGFIGHLPGFGTYNGQFFGTLDEVRVWNVNRTGTELVSNKDCALTGTEAGLVAYYDFNNGFAGANNAGLTTLIDESSNSNNGTLINFDLSGPTSNWVEGANISGTCVPPPACPTTNAFGSIWINSAYKAAGANDPFTYYWGLSNGTITAKPTGGAAPYTYNWYSGAGYSIMNATSKRARLWYPTGPQWVYVDITDATNCTVTDSVYIDWVDFTCNQPLIWWYQLCDINSNTPLCVKGTANMRSLVQTGDYVFGNCNQPAKTAFADNSSNSAELGINVFPNPNNGAFTITLSNTTSAVYEVKVLDMNGRVLFADTFNSTDNYATKELQLDGIAAGMYMVHISDGNSHAVERVVIQ